MIILKIIGAVSLVVIMVIAGINVLDEYDTYLINMHPPDDKSERLEGR